MAVLAGREGSVGWQVARAAAVVLATLAVVAVETRLRDGRPAGRLAAFCGAIVLAFGAGFLPFVAERPASLESVAALSAVATGAVLVAAGTALATRGWHPPRRILASAGAIVGAAVLTFVVGPAVAATNVPPTTIDASPADRGLAYESVTLTTEDGVRLAGWYIASTNRAALVLLHGAGSTRSSVLDEATVLARHGFGVLLIDARGHGASGGTAMDFGWHGDSDIAAATGYLASRPDVDTDRIGIVGMSMGGEEAIGASAANGLIRAVVAEGATARNAADEDWLSDEFGVRGLLQEQLERLQDWVTDALTSASVPTSLRAAVEASGDTRYFLITAGEVADESRAAAFVAAAAPERVQLWTVPKAGHAEGLATRPAEWEARVIAFLEETLGIG
jgi:dienelactone hydrolase